MLLQKSVQQLAKSAALVLKGSQWRIFVMVNEKELKRFSCKTGILSRHEGNPPRCSIPRRASQDRLCVDMRLPYWVTGRGG